MEQRSLEAAVEEPVDTAFSSARESSIRLFRNQVIAADRKFAQWEVASFAARVAQAFDDVLVVENEQERKDRVHELLSFLRLGGARNGGNVDHRAVAQRARKQLVSICILDEGVEILELLIFPELNDDDYDQAKEPVVDEVQFTQEARNDYRGLDVAHFKSSEKIATRMPSLDTWIQQQDRRRSLNPKSKKAKRNDLARLKPISHKRSLPPNWSKSFDDALKVAHDAISTVPHVIGVDPAVSRIRNSKKRSIEAAFAEPVNNKDAILINKGGLGNSATEPTKKQRKLRRWATAARRVLFVYSEQVMVRLKKDYGSGVKGKKPTKDSSRYKLRSYEKKLQLKAKKIGTHNPNDVAEGKDGSREELYGWHALALPVGVPANHRSVAMLLRKFGLTAADAEPP